MTDEIRSEVVNPAPELSPWLIALGDTSLTIEQRRRLLADRRLVKLCEACTHPGYMHEHAEEQYTTGYYGVPLYEADDLPCEADGCDGCGWYEGDNWKAGTR